VVGPGGGLVRNLPKPMGHRFGCVSQFVAPIVARIKVTEPLSYYSESLCRPDRQVKPDGNQQLGWVTARANSGEAMKDRAVSARPTPPGD